MRIRQLSVAFLILGIFICGAALLNFVPAKKSPSSLQKTSMTDRDLAIEQAKKEGKTTYHYTTNFIPGIGTIGDPQQYEQSWAEQQQNTTK